MIRIRKSYVMTERIKSAWRKMEENECVTPYLYLSFMKYVRWQNYLMARIPILYYVEDDFEEIIMIAPMSYDLLTGRYDTMGDVGYCDITDFLYKPLMPYDKKNELIALLLASISKSINFHRLNIESDTSRILQGRIKRTGIVSCVNIPLEPDYSSNISRLSSSVRQNIRTAYNRLNRESKHYNLIVHFGNMKDAKKMRTDIKNCYERRHFSAYSYNLGFIRYWLHFINVKYLRHDNFSLFSNENTVQVALYIEGKVAGMFAGILNKKEDRLLIPRLAIDLDYKFYSPGYIMLCESIKYFLSNTSIRNVDLCRGTEKYKFDLGGVKYDTQYAEFVGDK